ncbi:MAG: tRNA pseudouridine(13) synthase TruD [Epsilonproteobacteria bacterium]|nr:tRNA pseudouridine(13) synthase TruD [Campylobacterota bacterium]
MQREYLESGEQLRFVFEQNQDDFVVDEVGIQLKGRGNFLVLHIKKVELTTWDMIAVFAEFLGTPAPNIGYAGLKDKHATTTQYISVSKKYETQLKKFKHKQIKILDKTYHDESLSMGDLEGNRFKINLLEVDQISAGKIEKRARKIVKNGLPNYFGYQRFGMQGDTLEQARQMIAGELHISDKKLKNFLISVYQSHHFNEWLKARVQLSKKQKSDRFVLLKGDVYRDQKGKLFTPKTTLKQDFADHKVTPTGLLCGRNVFRARDAAREIEEKFDDQFLQEKGQRRDAIVFVKDLTLEYNNKFDILNISFTLPKGSYATVFLEAIAGMNFKAKG